MYFLTVSLPVMSSSKSKSRRHQSDSEEDDRRGSKSSVFERLGGSSKGTCNPSFKLGWSINLFTKQEHSDHVGNIRSLLLPTSISQI